MLCLTRLIPAFVALLAAAPCARSVVVALDDSTSYTQAPTPAVNNFGFGNVAIVTNFTAGIPASGVYVGNGWILTAYHNLWDGGTGLQVSSVSLQGVSYTGDPSTAVRLHNANSTLTDLAMFRLTTIPSGVPGVTLAGTAPGLGDAVHMMGNGVDRELTEMHWDSAWQEQGSTSTYNGYELAGTRSLRWGTNNLSSNLLNIGGGFGTFTGFSTTFDPSNGDAHATGGDSGGGVFRKVGGNWELTGIMLGVDAPKSGQPANTILFGDRTFSANISTYKTEIESIRALPEPSAAVFCLAGAALAAQRRRRAQKRP